MAAALAPTTVLDLAEAIAGGGPFDVQGTGMRAGFGRATPTLPVLRLSAFNTVISYEPEELVLEAGAGLGLDAVQALLASRNQMLAFEPPDLRHLWGAAGSGSLGGVLATGLAGPRRIRAGSVRDHVLGVAGVTGRGEMFKAGARVVKNVTGYDVPKLMAGSFGTLAALTAVTFKVMPAAETEETVLVPGLGDAAALQLLSEALQGPFDISGAAHVPGEGAYLRFEGTAVSVAARRDRFVGPLRQTCEILNAAPSRAVWARIRDCKVFTVDGPTAVWRISVAPTEGAAVAQRIAAQVPARHYFDWGGGLLWVAVSAGADAATPIIRGAFSAGHATLLRAPDAVRAAVPVFQPQAPAVAALTQRLKAAFDPARKLSPARMYAGV